MCKDTPGFIGNRVGIFSLMNCVHNAIKHKLSVGEVDALTGKFVFRPKSATFRTIDIIGLDTLKNLNVDIKIGHSPSNLNRDTDVLVYSSAVPIENPEIVRARQKGIPVIRRAEMLGAVSYTHLTLPTKA